MRESNNELRNERLWNGFDYQRQAWVVDGKYVACGHPETVKCNCYGRLHAREEVRVK